MSFYSLPGPAFSLLLTPFPDPLPSSTHRVDFLSRRPASEPDLLLFRVRLVDTAVRSIFYFLSRFLSRLVFTGSKVLVRCLVPSQVLLQGLVSPTPQVHLSSLVL